MDALRVHQWNSTAEITTGGSSNAYTLKTAREEITGYYIGMGPIRFIASFSNTGAATLDINGIGAIALKKEGGTTDLASGDIVSGGIYTVLYDGTYLQVLELNFNPSALEADIATNAADIAALAISGEVLLTSGSVSSATEIELDLTSYTSYRGLKLLLIGIIPTTDNVNLIIRVSTDGGSSYDAGASDYSWFQYVVGDNGTSTIVNSAADTSIRIAGSVANASTGGIDMEVLILGQTSTARWPKISYKGVYATPVVTNEIRHVSGGGIRQAAQDTDALQIQFSSGDINGDYAIYGLN